MIMCHEGEVKIRGTLPEMLQDTVHILNGVYRTMIEKHGEEIANEHLAKIGRIAVITDTDERDELLKEYIHAENDKMLAELPEEIRGLAELFGVISDVIEETGDE